MDAHGNKIFCKAQRVQIFFEGAFCFHYSIIKDSNADLTVGNSNSKKDP